jgi:hypothetical protein
MIIYYSSNKHSKDLSSKDYNCGYFERLSVKDVPLLLSL